MDNQNDVVERLLNFRSSDAPVISLYVGITPDPGDLKAGQSQIHALVKPLRELLDSDGLGHYERESLRADIERIGELRERVRELQGRGLAVFTCNRDHLYEEIKLPRQVRDRVVVDETPYLTPAVSVLAELRHYCVVVVERNQSWLFDYFGQDLEAASQRTDPTLPKKTVDERHVQHKDELVAHRHYRSTVDAMREMMTATGAELVVVGGHQETVAEFLPFVPHDLQDRVIGTFVIDPHTMTQGQVREHAEPLVDAYEQKEAAELTAEVFEKVAIGGFGAVGLEWCLLAANEKGTEILLVADGAQAPGRVCDNCGWLGLAGDECPVCGRPARETPDVVDDMAEAVMQTHGRVVQVRDEPELARNLVGARLRFPVPRPGSAASG